MPVKDKYKHLHTPLNNHSVSSLGYGDMVKINGSIFSARDAAHKKLIEFIDQGSSLPFNAEGQIVYYVGPTPAKPDEIIGSAGPTTSSRMDSMTIPMLQQGIKGMIGKGKRNQQVINACRDYKSVYFAAVGGAGAFLSKCIKKSEIIAFPELGPEAIYKFTVKDFPAVVINDVYGNDLYEKVGKGEL